MDKQLPYYSAVTFILQSSSYRPYEAQAHTVRFALLLTKVTKPPYPANISFYTIAGKDTNLCAMSGTGFRKRGEEYDDETNNQWYDRDRVSGS